MNQPVVKFSRTDTMMAGSNKEVPVLVLMGPAGDNEILDCISLKIAQKIFSAKP